MDSVDGEILVFLCIIDLNLHRIRVRDQEFPNRDPVNRFRFRRSILTGRLRLGGSDTFKGTS